MRSLGSKTNRLIHEKSPYLLQHAYNPVNWFPWGEEAFEKAASEDKPVFLSIGYSTCHWCHVMERESFIDEGVAEALNNVFIPVKVDREERPDIDSVYMKVCQMMTGGGGWPLTVLMTPDKRPFYVNTYIPRESRYGRIGLLELIQEVDRLWKTDREHINKVAENATRTLQQTISEGGSSLDEEVLRRCYLQLSQSYDPVYGGFGRSPKFPIPHQLLFLLRHWHRSGDSKALSMVEKTLRSIRMGGVYDQLGGGVHRYSTDSEWLVPHFEKMLYDQALIAMAYTEAYQATGNPFYRDSAKHILDYALSEMSSPEGGFYSAYDADSEGEEGKFYLWTKQEIDQILGEAAQVFNEAYNVQADGNYYDEATRRRNGRNILHMTKTLKELAEIQGIKETRLRESLRESTNKLLLTRIRRVRPGLDDKILVGWNGLMIAALSRAGRIFKEGRYLEAANAASSFILDNMVKLDGGLVRRYRDGDFSVDGFIDDYAYLTWGLLEQYASNFDPEHLHAAIKITKHLLEYFWDEKDGGLFVTGDDSEKMLTRLKETYDGAVPSGNSVAALNLITLSRILGDPDLEQKASQIINSFSDEIERSPASHTYILSAFDYLIGASSEVIIRGERNSPDTETIINTLNTHYNPNKVTVLVTPEDKDRLYNVAEYLKQYKNIDDKTTVYVCSNHVCQKPSTNLDEILTQLGKLRAWKLRS